METKITLSTELGRDNFKAATWYQLFKDLVKSYQLVVAQEVLKCTLLLKNIEIFNCRSVILLLHTEQQLICYSFVYMLISLTCLILE